MLAIALAAFGFGIEILFVRAAADSSSHASVGPGFWVTLVAVLFLVAFFIYIVVNWTKNTRRRSRVSSSLISTY